MSFNVGGLRLNQPFRIRRIGHVGYHSPDVNATAAFLSNQLGFSISDVDDFTKRVPELSKDDATGWFLRCGTDHHTVVLGSQNLVDTREPARKGALVGQMSWQVGSLKEVVDGVDFLNKNAKIRRIGRDAPGSNWHAYVYDPDGYINEIFYGMEQVGWDGRSKPTSMYDRAFTTCPDLPQIPEYKEVDVAMARGDVLDGFRFKASEEARYSVDGVLMPQPFKVTRLGRMALFVADLEVSLEFYTKVMGLQVTERVAVNGYECAFLRADDEHHTLALFPNDLREGWSFDAAYGLAVASYQQLLDAKRFLQEQGARFLDLPAEISPGISYAFWVQGPDRMAIQLYYGMDRVERDGSAPRPITFPVPEATFPESIAHPGAAWYEPPFMGPLA